MGEGYLTAEPIAGMPERLAHIADQQKLGWRYAIGMGGDSTLTNIDLAVREQCAKMIIRSAIAETELKDHAIEIANQMSGVVQASALRFKAAYKTI
jgi:hypothetical protein